MTFSLLPIVQAMTVVVRDYTQYEVVEEELRYLLTFVEEDILDYSRHGAAFPLLKVWGPTLHGCTCKRALTLTYMSFSRLFWDTNSLLRNCLMSCRRLHSCPPLLIRTMFTPSADRGEFVHKCDYLTPLL